MCVVALLLGMLLSNMLKNVCGCKTVEGVSCITDACTESHKGYAAGCTTMWADPSKHGGYPADGFCNIGADPCTCTREAVIENQCLTKGKCNIGPGKCTCPDPAKSDA